MGNFFLFYIIALLGLLPLTSILLEVKWSRKEVSTIFTYALAIKWFIFWAIGIRLLSAGLSQVLNPSFTGAILHLPESGFIILRELGFANCCFGLLGSISLFLGAWRIPASFAGGLYLGTAGFQHLHKGLGGMNSKETIVMVSDLIIFFVVLFYLGTNVFLKKEKK